MSVYGSNRDHRDDGCHIRVAQAALAVAALALTCVLAVRRVSDA